MKELTRDEIFNMPAGIELNALVAGNVLQISDYEHIFHGEICIKCHRETDFHSGRIYPDNKRTCDIPDDYSADIAAAWLVHQMVVHKLFSVRQRYFEELQKLVSAECTESGKTVIAYPDVFIFVKPSHFCRAALLAVKE